MSWKVWVPLCLLGLAGLFLAQPVYDALRGEGALERWFVWGGEEEGTESFWLRCDGRQVVFSQGGQEQVMGDVTKTQVMDGSAHISGTLGMMNVQDFAFVSLATRHVGFAAGGVNCLIRDYSGFVSGEYDWTYIGGFVGPEMDHAYTVIALWWTAGRLTPMGPLNSVLGYQYYYYDPGETEEPLNIELDFDYSITGRQRTCEESVVPTGDRDVGPAYGHEVHYADALTDLDTVSWEITFGPWSWEGSYDVDDFFEDPPVVPISLWVYSQEQHHWNDGVHYGKFRVAWDGVDMALARYHLETADWRWEGIDGGIDVYGNKNGGTGSITNRVVAYRPYGVDYSDFAIEDPFGNVVGDELVLTGNVQASNHLPASLGWSTTPDGLTKGGASPGDSVYPTVAELRAVGEYVDPPTITGLDYRDPDDSHKFLTSPAHQWALTEEGVQATAETVGHEDDDLTICLRLPGIDASDLAESPDREVVTITHPEQVGVYGPGPALDNGDWVGGDGVSSTDGSGNFAVSGDGELALTIPCNLGTFLDMIPLQVFPTGMPGLPNMGRWHKADVHRAYDGELDQNGDPFSVPLEGVYCARGWPCLRLNFPTAAAQDTLTVALTVLTHTYSDGHWTSSKRQTGTDEEPYEHTTTEHTYTYEVTLDESGVGYVYLTAPQEGDKDPDLEQVAAITISGFSDGSWQINEPHWCLDPDDGVGADAITVKVFEGRDYYSGGLTAVVESVARCALCDTQEDNGNHANLVEWPVVRMWDYRISDPENEVQLDFTRAYGLAGWIADIEKLSDAWETDFDSDEWDAMTLDEDDNRLTDGYSFNFCGPLDGDSRIVQVAGGGLNASLRGRSWTAVAGFVYPILPDKVIHGAMHGPLLDGDGNLVRNDTGDKVWRREQGSDDEWVEHDTPGSNAAGFWTAKAGEVYATYDPAATLYEYGTGDDADNVTSTGRWARGEYDIADLLSVVLSPHDVWLSPYGLLYQLKAVGNTLKVYRLPWPQGGEWEGGVKLATASQSPTDLCLLGMYRAPYLRAAWREGDNVMYALTFDQGDSCDGPYSEAFGYSASRHAILFRRWFTAGLKSGVWYLRYRDADVLPPVWLPFSNGQTETTICSSEATEMFMCGDARGCLYAVFDGAIYYSLDSGTTWAQAATFTPTGWTQINGTVLGNRLLLVGYSSGWKSKLFYLAGDTVTEATGSDGLKLHSLTGVPNGYGAPEISSQATPLLVVEAAAGTETHYSDDYGENWVELT